jgi:hypothetical protein
LKKLTFYPNLALLLLYYFYGMYCLFHPIFRFSLVLADKVTKIWKHYLICLFTFFKSLACLALQTEIIVKKITQPKLPKMKNKFIKICNEPGNRPSYFTGLELNNNSTVFSYCICNDFSRFLQNISKSSFTQWKIRQWLKIFSTDFIFSQQKLLVSSSSALCNKILSHHKILSTALVLKSGKLNKIYWKMIYFTFCV